MQATFAIDAFNTWLKDHPLQGGLIFCVLSVFLGWVGIPVLTTVWKFCKIPPQRLSIWILKARIADAEARFNRFRQMNSDLKYLILYCFASLLFTSLALAFFIAGCALGLQYSIEHTVHPSVLIKMSDSVLPILSWGAGYLTIMASLSLGEEVINAIILPNKTEMKLSSKKEQLEEKLRLKSNIETLS